MSKRFSKICVEEMVKLAESVCEFGWIKSKRDAKLDRI